MEYAAVSPFADISLVEHLDSFTLTQVRPIISLPLLSSTRLFHFTTTAWLEEGLRSWVFGLWKQTHLALGNATLTSVFSLAPTCLGVPLTDTLLNFNDVLGATTSKFDVLTTYTLGDTLDVLALWRNFVTYQTAF